MMDDTKTKKIQEMATWMHQDAHRVAFTIGMIRAGDPLYADNIEYSRRLMRDNLESILRLAGLIQRELGDE